MGLAHLSLVPQCHSFFLSFSFFLSSSFRMTPWGTRALWIHFFAWASKTQSGRRPVSSPGRGRPASSPHREGACSLREQSKFRVRSFIGFLCKPRKIKPLSLPFNFPYRRRRHPEGFPGSCQGWTPAQGEYTHSLQKFSVYKTRQIEILFSWFFILMTNDGDKGKHDSFWEAKNQ